MGDDNGLGPCAQCCSAFGTFLLGVGLLITVLTAVGAGKEAQNLSDEIDALNDAASARCLFSRRPGTPNTWVSEQTVGHGNGVSTTHKWTACECAVTVHYDDGKGMTGSAAGTVFAGIDWTHQRDVHAWCDDALSQDWKNIQIQGKWARYDKSTGGNLDHWAAAQKNEPGWVCGTRHVVTGEDVQKQMECRDCDKDGCAKPVGNCDAKSLKYEPNPCGDATLKDGGEAACSVDGGGQVRLGSAESHKRQNEKMLEEAEGTLLTCALLACVFCILFCSLGCFATCGKASPSYLCVTSCCQKKGNSAVVPSNPEKYTNNSDQNEKATGG